MADFKKVPGSDGLSLSRVIEAVPDFAGMPGAALYALAGVMLALAGLVLISRLADGLTWRG